MSNETESLRELGKFGRAQGLRGEVRFWAHNPNSPLLKKGQQARIGLAKSSTVLVTINRLRRDGKGLVIGLEGCTDRTAAEALTGQYWYFSRSEFKPLGHNEVYVADLIGLNAIQTDGTSLGPVTDVVEVGPNLILMIKVGHREIMVPYVDDFVGDVDLEQGELRIRVVDGLLDTGRA
jgi:16S rRNA processing protein RimM